MPKLLKFQLPVAPPLNNAYFNVLGGGRKKTARHRKWIKNADAHYVLQGLQRAEKITVPYACTMRFPPLRSDIDGRAKLTLDWMVSRGLTIDDKHCRRLVLEDGDPTSKLVNIEVVPHEAE